MKNGIAIRVGVFIFVAMITVTSPGSTHAVTITGGSVLLDASAASQLQTWLGEIEIVLDKIFTATPGGGAVTNTMFHAAEDGKGRTFTVVSITSGAVPGPIIFGGYNPPFVREGVSVVLGRVEGSYGMSPRRRCTDGRVPHGRHRCGPTGYYGS